MLASRQLTVEIEETLAYGQKDLHVLKKSHPYRYCLPW
jgi:hypothetical protein